jgi:hypothetical protein
MKMLGGDWSRGDAIALAGVIVAIVGVAVALLAVPGMPKVIHLDADTKSSTAKPPEATDPPSARPTMKPVDREVDVTSGQVNFGCDETLPVETPVVPFGLNPRNVVAQPNWSNTNNEKSHNQRSENVESPSDHRLTGTKAVGSISGLDSQSIFGVKNCPGGGHGELTLHVTWTEDQPAAR